jgi:hypothetical protein
MLKVWVDIMYWMPSFRPSQKWSCFCSSSTSLGAYHDN